MFVLDPQDSLGEILFGLIMVLTFTLGAGLAVGHSEEEARTLIYGAIGCNIAWGLIDAVFYLMGQLFARGRRGRIFDAFHAAATKEDAIAIVRNELDDELSPITDREGRERLYEGIYTEIVDVEPPPNRLTSADLRGAVVVFFLVALTSVPAILPFFFIDDPKLALRASNLLLLALMFFVGYRWARFTRANPWMAGAGITSIGVVLVVVAIALGG